MQPKGVNVDSRQISIVRESFKEVFPHGNKMTRVLYDRLFELNPDLRKLFKKDLRDQRKKLFKHLRFIVDNLHDASIIGPEVKKLAANHLSYGVTEDDYETFGKALNFALSAALGNNFTPEVKSAWNNVYYTIAQVMINETYR